MAAARTTALLVATLACVGLVACGTQPVSNTPSTVTHAPTSSITESTDCIQLDDAGTHHWIGQAGSELQALGDALQQLVDDNPDEATGVAYCSDLAGAAIFVSSPGQDLVAAISATAAKYPGLTVTTESVAAPLSLLMRLGPQLMGDAALTSVMVSVGPDMYTGGLEIGIDDASWSVSDAIQGHVEQTLRNAHRQAIPVKYFPAVAGENSAG